MIAKGKIQNLAYSIGGGYTVTVDIKDAKLEDLKKLEGEDLSVELKKYREKRSLDANAYFHVLVGKIADSVGTSRDHIKNELIGHYGQPEIIEGKNVYMTTQVTPAQMREQEFLHTVLVNVKEQKGRTFYTYMVMRGSHTYDTKEMATLIDGTISMAKEYEIETMTSEALERMKQAWKQNA